MRDNGTQKHHKDTDALLCEWVDRGQERVISWGRAIGVKEQSTGGGRCDTRKRANLMARVGSLSDFKHTVIRVAVRDRVRARAKVQSAYFFCFHTQDIK